MSKKELPKLAPPDPTSWPQFAKPTIIEVDAKPIIIERRTFLRIREPYSYRVMVRTKPRLSQQGLYYFDAKLLETTDPKPEIVCEGHVGRYDHYGSLMIGRDYTISVENPDFITEFEQMLKKPENVGYLLKGAVIDIHTRTLLENGRGPYQVVCRTQRLGQRLRERLRQLLSE
jgi:hypothetical protein